jgi:hypothetical protein
MLFFCLDPYQSSHSTASAAAPVWKSTTASSKPPHKPQPAPKSGLLLEISQYFFLKSGSLSSITQGLLKDRVFLLIYQQSMLAQKSSIQSTENPYSS